MDKVIAMRVVVVTFFCCLSLAVYDNSCLAWFRAILKRACYALFLMCKALWRKSSAHHMVSAAAEWSVVIAAPVPLDESKSLYMHT